MTSSWFSWWRHQMEIFSALLAICAGNSPVPGEFPIQRPVTRSFDVYFDLRPNKRLSKQWWGWWFETQSCPLWRHRNGKSWFEIRWMCTIHFDAVCISSVVFCLIIFQNLSNSNGQIIEIFGKSTQSVLLLFVNHGCFHDLTYCPLVTHTCVCELDQHWCR